MEGEFTRGIEVREVWAMARTVCVPPGAADTARLPAIAEHRSVWSAARRRVEDFAPDLAYQSARVGRFGSADLQALLASRLKSHAAELSIKTASPLCFYRMNPFI